MAVRTDNPAPGDVFPQDFVIPDGQPAAWAVGKKYRVTQNIGKHYLDARDWRGLNIITAVKTVDLTGDPLDERTEGFGQNGPDTACYGTVWDPGVDDILPGGYSTCTGGAAGIYIETGTGLLYLNVVTWTAVFFAYITLFGGGKPNVEVI